MLIYRYPLHNASYEPKTWASLWDINTSHSRTSPLNFRGRINHHKWTPKYGALRTARLASVSGVIARTPKLRKPPSFFETTPTP